MIRAVDNEAATTWTQTIGDVNTDATKSAYSVGFSVIQVSISIDISSVSNNCVYSTPRAAPPCTRAWACGRRAAACRPPP